MAENAVDNGVELRIRRQVQHIQSTSSGFMVQCRYWEPNSYIQSIQKHQFSLNKLGGIVAAGMLALACLTVGQPQGATRVAWPARQQAGRAQRDAGLGRDPAWCRAHRRRDADPQRGPAFRHAPRTDRHEEGVERNAE